MAKENQLKKENFFCPKVLLYSGLPRNFRASIIGYLYEIAQVWPVVLLSQKLDPETERILNDKKLFPKLEEIVPIQYDMGKKKNWLIKNRYFHKLANKVIQDHKPDIVIMPTRYPYPLQFYLKRFAKRIKAINVQLRGVTQRVETKQLAAWYTLMSTYFKTPAFLPFWIRVLFTKCKRYSGHFFYYWILPLAVGESPFLREPSCVLLTRVSGKSADYFISPSKRDYDLCLREGIPAEKLYILTHPLERETRRFFEKIYFLNKPYKSKVNTKSLTLMWPYEQIGFRRENLALISRKEVAKSRIKIVTLITEILKGWKIFIKPHPTVKNVTEIERTFEPISDYIEVTKSSEPADKYIEMAEVIIGFPPGSATIYTASLQCPEKIILSLDLEQELLGDFYKDFEGIEYIDKEEKFIEVLKLIRDGKYPKRHTAKHIKKRNRKEFSNTAELLKHLFHKSRNL